MSLIPLVQGGHSTASGFDSSLIGNSAWFDGSADYLEKTFSSAPGSQSGKRYVWACWVQPPGIFNGTVFSMWCAGTSASNAYTALEFYNQQSGGGDLEFYSYNGGTSYDFRLRPTQVFRDTAWQSFIVSYDSTESSASNRIKIYHNGQEITSFAQSDYPSVNHVDFPGTAVAHTVGARTGGSGGGFYKNYMTQHVFLDSQSIQAGDVSIGSLLDVFQHGTNGSQRVCKKDSDIAALATTADHNSFCLDFADASNFGNDISGNSPSGENDFTVNSMGSANQSSNTPSKNYSTFNPLAHADNSYPGSFTLSEGNQKNVIASGSSGSNTSVKTTLPFVMAGGNIIRAQFTFSTLGDGGCGITGSSHTSGTYHTAATSVAGRGEVGLCGNGALVIDGNFNNSYTSALSNGDVVDVIVNCNVGAVYFAVDGTLLGGATQSEIQAGTTTNAALVSSFVRRTAGEVFNFYAFQFNPSSTTIEYNSGQSSFTHSYSTITSLISLNTADLPAPTHQGIDHFNAVKYAGNGTAIGSGGKAVTGVGFQPDWVWIKNRDASDSHALYDVVRGTTKQIETDTTAIETTEAEGLSVFGSDGFTLGSLAEVNTSSEDYISWNWKAGGSASSNSNGSLTSSVSAATPGHFSIVSWTGNTTHGATVGHGLSGTPEFIIAIARNASGENKPIFHVDAVTSDNRHIKINEANMGTAGTTIWDVSAMSSTVFGLGAAAQSNSGNGMIAYCFRSVPGVCKVGSYIGNGNSSDGPFVFTGFLPRWIFIKNYSADQNWMLWDTARSPYNQLNNNLWADIDSGESTSSTYGRDILAGGFKLRGSSHAIVNASGNSYLYVCMADIASGAGLAPIYGR